MKNKIFLLLILSAPAPALATGMVAGATEPTQWQNNFELVKQYATQVDQYARQGLQYQSQLLDMKLNPTSFLGSDVTKLVNGIGGIMQAEQSIGGSLSKIDANFSRQFKNPLAGTFSEKFKSWTNTSQDTLGAAMRSAGMHRDAYVSDTAALQALYAKTQRSQGTVAAVQTLGEINAMQVQQTQKLSDLIATQNIATSAYMAGQNSKDQAKQDIEDRLWSFKREEPPKPRAANPKNF